jgi:hypothetical protein
MPTKEQRALVRQSHGVAVARIVDPHAIGGLAIDPHSAALFAARGAGETMVNRHDEGIADVQKAKQMNRYDPDVLYWAR